MGRNSVDMSIVGKRFGKLTVIDFSHKDKGGTSHWLCECDCGNTVVIARGNLGPGRTTSCGCRRSEKPVESLINRRFGKLTVVEFDHRDESGKRYWLCECDCGNAIVAEGHHLKSGHTTSCGCKKYERRSEELLGKRFGRLVVLDFDHMGSCGRQYWLCECDCGERTIVRRSCLLSGHTTSCGCYRAEIIEGLSTRGGLSSTRLYNIWCGLISRCTREDHRYYHRYGGRGITVCEDWYDFEHFYKWALENGYEPGLSIDRIDNDDGYYPENCRWTDQITQANNTSTNRHITWNGLSHTIAEWARLLGVDYHAFYRRITRGDMRDFETYYEECEENNRNDH